MRAQPSGAVYGERESQGDKQGRKYMEICPLSASREISQLAVLPDVYHLQR